MFYPQQLSHYTTICNLCMTALSLQRFQRSRSPHPPCRHFVQPRPGGDSAMQRNEFLHYCNFFHLHLNCESSKETFIAKPLTLCPLHCTVMRKLHGIPLHPPPVLLQRGLFIGHLWRLLPSSISPPLRKKEKKVPLI